MRNGYLQSGQRALTDRIAEHQDLTFSLDNDTRILLELSLFEMVGTPYKHQYRCLICGDHVLVRIRAERHVLMHYLDKSIVDSALPLQAQEEDDAEGPEEQNEEEDIRVKQPHRREGHRRRRAKSST